MHDIALLCWKCR